MIINYRNIVRNDDNVIISGSASLVKNAYKPNPKGNHKGNHSKRVVVERLGKVLWIDPDDRMKGIFNSPKRGLVHYDLSLDRFTDVSPSDERLAGTKFHIEEPSIHTNFGNTYLFFSELSKTPFMSVLRKSFGENNSLYQKVLAHVAHDCLRNGAAIKCGDFLKRDVLSCILSDVSYSTLNCDSLYYQKMSDDTIKVRFFQTLLTEMRKENPEFGRGCYVDSTPLPGEAENNPFNALSNHGTGGAEMQSRLVLVLDIQTNIPMWFEIIPANVLDKSTLQSISADVKAPLGVTIFMFALDAGYARKELFEAFNRNNSMAEDENGNLHERSVLVRMPAANGYPHDELYVTCKPDIDNVDYVFDYEYHTFFGRRIEVNLFEQPEFAYVYVDKTQAEALIRNWREDNYDEWCGLTRSQKEWYQVKNGFFILIGNKEQTPRDALIDYRSRAHIESFFRDAKAYLKILPMAKWDKQTVTGKIFHDIIETTIYRAYRKRVAPAHMTMSGLNVCLDSWECFRSDTLLVLKTPNVDVREALEKLGYSIPGHLEIEDLRREILEGIPMSRIPVTLRTKRNTANNTAPLSPEEKLAAQEKGKNDILRKRAEDRKDKAVARAEKKYLKAKEKALEARDNALKTAKEKLGKLRKSYKREECDTKDCDSVMAKITDMIDSAKKACEETLALAKESLEKAKSEALAEYEQNIKSLEQQP